jgi:tripeptide aminopeptidase
MTTANLEFLKEVLSVRTVTRNETMMVEFLCNYFTDKGYDFTLDHMNNVYVTKGNSDVFPCVISHTDTVHRIQSLNVRETYGKRLNNFGQTYDDVVNRLQLTGTNDKGYPSGIGGDDKCGVYVCLRLLEQFENIKAAFFVSEETGCWGSREADPAFFSNVGYTIQFDAPGDRLVTEVCSGIRLFDRGSEFFEIVDATLNLYDDFLYQEHPYTDVSQIKMKFDHACINISCGYYHMHRPDEFVDVEDVERTVIVATDLINRLGWRKYEYKFDLEQAKRERAARDRKWKEEEKQWRQKHKEELAKWKTDYLSKYGEIPPAYKQFFDEDEEEDDDDSNHIFLN